MRKSTLVFSIGFFVLAFVSVPIHAQSKHFNGGLDFVLSAGVTAGGDELISDPSRPAISAGGGQTFAVGISVPVGHSAFSIQSSVGFHLDYISFTGHDSFNRYPLEVVPFYSAGQHRIGGGLSYVHSARYKNGSSSGDSVSARFENALGFLVEYNYIFRRSNITLGVRYQSIEYKLDSERGDTGVSSGTIDGSFAGISIGWMI